MGPRGPAGDTDEPGFRESLGDHNSGDPGASAAGRLRMEVAMTGSNPWSDANALADPSKTSSGSSHHRHRRLHPVWPHRTDGRGPGLCPRPGLVARCPTCDQVLLRLVRGPGRAWLDLRGLTYLQLTAPDQT